MSFFHRHGLWVILALALGVRLLPMLFEHQAGQDITEYENIAGNLRAGRGFVSDIKAYWAAPGNSIARSTKPGYRSGPPTQHYALTDRPILLPGLLALLRLALPPLTASQMIGPLLYLLALMLIYKTLHREIGPAAAFSVGLLLALNPVLFDLSLKPLSENTVLLALALIVWAHYDMRSPMLTGMACSLAFLARPSSLLFAAVLGIIYLAEALRSRQPWRMLQFACFAAIGPIWIMAFNRTMGMPLTTLPQAFLFKVRSFEDGMNTFHRGAVYGSALELIRANGHEVARRVALNGLYYAKALVSSESLGMLLALLPISVAGLAQTQSRPLRSFRWLALFALLDLGLYVATWSTFDASRFLCVPIFIGILLIALGSHEIFDREPLSRKGGSWQSAASWAALAIGAVWLALDAGHGYLALREWQLNRPLSKNVEAAWTAPGVRNLMTQLDKAREGNTHPAQLPVVASNDPWLVNHPGAPARGQAPLGLKWTGMAENPEKLRRGSRGDSNCRVA